MMGFFDNYPNTVQDVNSDGLDSLILTPGVYVNATEAIATTAFCDAIRQGGPWTVEQTEELLKNSKLISSINMESSYDFYRKYKIDEDLVDLFYDLLMPCRLSFDAGPWIAGGALRRGIQGQKLSNFTGDIDIFCRDEKQYLFIFDLISHKCSSENMTSSYYSSTGKMHVAGRETPIKIQIVKHKFFKNVNELFENFDLFCCMVATDGVNVSYAPDALTDISERKLNYNWKHMSDYEKNKNKSATLYLKRFSKFISEGYSPASSNTIWKLTKLIQMLPPDQYSNIDRGYTNL